MERHLLSFGWRGISLLKLGHGPTPSLSSAATEIVSPLDHSPSTQITTTGKSSVWLTDAENEVQETLNYNHLCDLGAWGHGSCHSRPRPTRSHFYPRPTPAIKETDSAVQYEVAAWGPYDFQNQDGTGEHTFVICLDWQISLFESTWIQVNRMEFCAIPLNSGGPVIFINPWL